MTPLQTVYDSFLSKMLDDEWATWTEVEVNKDLFQLLVGAITHFKFPRVDLTIADDNFIGDLGNQEIQILATYMRCGWLDRTILTWENIKTLYSERDFSQANLLDKLKNLSESEWKKAERLESKYYRSINFRPYKYGNLAGRDAQAAADANLFGSNEEFIIDASGAELDE